MVSIPSKLKQFLIIITAFGIVYWFQQVDDKKRCKKRETIYDNIKLPLLVSAFVGLILFWDNDRFITIFSSNDVSVNEVRNTAPPEFISAKDLPKVEGGINHPEFDVYTSLPEW